MNDERNLDSPKSVTIMFSLFDNAL